MGSLCRQKHLGGLHDLRNVWRCLAFILTVMIVSSGAETKKASERDLRAKLFENYDKLSRPVVDHRTAITVYVGLTPLVITELDEEKQILELDSWIYMKWSDEYLVWDPEEYDGITALNVPSTEIWRPDLTIYSGSPAKKMIIEVLTHAIVNYTGDVLWVPPVDIHNRCPQEINSYQQQDSQTCVIRIGSWTYHEYMLDIQPFHSEVKMEYFKNTNPNWELFTFTAERQSKYYSCCKEPYPVIEFKISVKRRSTGRASRKCTRAQQMSQMMHYNCFFTPRLSFDTGCD